jgi:hypothetical protein
LPPIAGELIHAIVANDRASAAQDRELASRFARSHPATRARRLSKRRAEPVMVSSD